MTIRNALLAGPPWTNGEVLFAEDLNDTFDAAVTLLQTIENAITAL